MRRCGLSEKCRAASRAALVVVVVLALAACGGTPAPTPTPTLVPTPTPGCAPDAVAAFLAEWDQIVDAWDDTNALANNTGRGSLSPVIQDMQRIKRDANGLETSCAEMVAVKDATVANMEHTIDGYLAFMAQESDGKVESHFGKARTAMRRLETAYAALAAYQ